MRVAILTISDSVSRGTHKDASGPALRERCAQLGWDVVSEAILPDEPAAIRDRLVFSCRQRRGGPDPDDRRHRNRPEGLHSRSHRGSLPETFARNLRTDARRRQEKNSARRPFSRRRGRSRARSNRQSAGQPARRSRIARRRCGFIAARPASPGRRAPRLSSNRFISPRFTNIARIH